jgi:hypothetical protein
VLRFQKLIIALVLIFCIGAQWPILQSVAWMRMLVSYSKAGGLETAITKTFDGKHPCKLCKLVSEGKKAEKKSEVHTLLKKIDLFPPAENSLMFPLKAFPGFPAVNSRELSLVYPPANPPPISA